MACAVGVGDTFGIDWESFGEEPAAFDGAATSGQRVVVALLINIGTSGATVGEVLASPPGSRTGAELTRVAGDEGLEPGDPAGALWYGYIRAQTHRIVYAPLLSDQGWTMAYDDGSVFVSDLNSVAGSTPELSVSALKAAGALVHEATHGLSGMTHVDCVAGTNEFPACDVDADGPHGVNHWFGYTWFNAGAAVQLEESACWVAVGETLDSCSNIIDISEFPACSDGYWEACGGG